MSNDNRVPAGVPTGGEFTTGAKAENPDLAADYEAHLALDYDSYLGNSGMTLGEVTDALGLDEDDAAALVEHLNGDGDLSWLTERPDMKPFVDMANRAGL